MYKRKLQLWFGLLALVLGLVSVGMLVVRTWTNRGEAPPPESTFVAGPAARLFEEVTYETCGHVTQQERLFPDAQRGLDLEHLAALYPGWDVAAREGDVHIRTTRPGLCPECRGRLFIGLAGEEVAVFFGTPEGPHELKERTGLFTRGLPEEAIRDLRQGIPIEDEKELPQILEGLMN
ncbi:MAG TPA: hypothetical protein GX511_00740 [Firmicutes bacterium]|nr:hypothetical protein [Bacillota bacterium]